MNSLRTYRIAELNAAIHDLTRRISAHRIRAPKPGASHVDRKHWKDVGADLVAEREALQAQRIREIEKAEAGAPC